MRDYIVAQICRGRFKNRYDTAVGDIDGNIVLQNVEIQEILEEVKYAVKVLERKRRRR